MLLGACQAIAYGTAERLNQVAIGMSEQQVIATLGAPDTSSARGSEKTLSYKLMPTVMSWAPRMYYVRLVDGRVESYGR
jgi:hypothetical protein